MGSGTGCEKAEWTCAVCKEVFSCKLIIEHYNVHPPSETPGCPEVNPALKDELRILSLELMHAEVFGAPAKRKPITLEELTGCSEPTSVDENNPVPVQKSSRCPSDASICSSDISLPNSTDSPPAPRKVAKKSCSGRKTKKHRKDNVPTLSSPVLSSKQTIAKKSCSGVKKSQEEKHLKSSDTQGSRSKIKNESSHRLGQKDDSPVPTTSKSVKSRSRDSSVHKSSKNAKNITRERSSSAASPSVASRPKLPKKRKQTTVAVEPKKAKINTKKVELLNKETKKFPRPPYIKSNPSRTSAIINKTHLMQEMMQEPQPLIPRLMEVMLETFPYRRHLYENLPDIKVTFAEFPALHQWEILKRDFELFKRASFDELNLKLGKRLELAYELAKSKYYLWPDPILQTASEKYRSSPNPDLLRDLQMMCLAYEKMGGKFCGHLYKIREKGRPPFARMTPTIDIRGEIGTPSVKIAVYCEGHEITKVPNFYEGVLCVYSVYWIFNLCYENVCQTFFEVFDNLIGEYP